MGEEPFRYCSPSIGWVELWKAEALLLLAIIVPAVVLLDPVRLAGAPDWVSSVVLGAGALCFAGGQVAVSIRWLARKSGG